MNIEEPLLVVRYVWWRVLRRIFVPYILGVFIFYSFGKYFLKESNSIAYITMYLIMLFCIFMVFNLLLIKDFRFYHDRLEKKWRLFGVKIVRYDEISVALTYMNIFIFKNRTIAFSQKGKYFYHITSLNRDLIDPSIEQKIIKVLADVSRRDASEFQENASLDPFIINTKKGA